MLSNYQTRNLENGIGKTDGNERMPKHSITHYQVIQLPRLSGDSEHGFVRLILESGEGFETLWRKLIRWRTGGEESNKVIDLHIGESMKTFRLQTVIQSKSFS